VPILNVESADSQFASAYLSFTSTFSSRTRLHYLVRVGAARLSSITAVHARRSWVRALCHAHLAQPERMAATTSARPKCARPAANNFLARRQTRGLVR